MQPAVPQEPRRPDDGQPFVSADDVGAFEQGSAFSRWALARYLVGRAVAASVSRVLLAAVAAFVVLAVLAQWLIHQTWLAVLLVLVALGALVLRAALDALLRRFTDARRYGPVHDRLTAMVDDTSRDVLAELRRIGLPSHTLTLPLLAFRLLGRRRAETVARLRQFDTARAVPPARIDELHMLLRHGGPA